MKPSVKKILIGILAGLFLCIKVSAISDALKVKITSGSTTDETVIRFLPTATTGFDGSWDAYKLFSSSSVAPAIFSKVDSLTELSINALPSISGLKSVSLFTHIKVSGTYTLQAISLGTGFQPGTKLALQDLFTGQLYNFSGGQSISLYMSANTVNSPSRFIIHFAPADVITSQNLTCNGANNGSVAVSKPGNMNWNYLLKNAAGAIVRADSSSTDSIYITGIEAGSYSLITYTPTGFPDSSAFVITEPAAIIADFTSVDTIQLSQPNVAFVNTSLNAGIFSWDMGDGSFYTEASPVHQFTNCGLFNVILTASDTMGCSASISKEITVMPDISTGVSDQSADAFVNVFQQEGSLHIDIRTENSCRMLVFVYNTSGQQLAKYSSEGISMSENMTLSTSGTYIVQALLNNKLQSKTITITK